MSAGSIALLCLLGMVAGVGWLLLILWFIDQFSEQPEGREQHHETSTHHQPPQS